MQRFTQKEKKLNFNLTDTQVGHVINSIEKEIVNNKKLYNLNIDLSHERPEILIVNDGNDSVKTSVNWKTNAITISQANDQLKALCEDTGGSYISFNYDQILKKVRVTSNLFILNIK